MKINTLDQLPIKESTLSTRAKKALVQQGIQTAADMVGMSEYELVKIRNIGAKTRGEILQWMENTGIPIGRDTYPDGSAQKTVELPIAPRLFEPVYFWQMNFIACRDKDNVMPGDTLFLKEWVDGDPPCYTGRTVTRKVGYVLRHAEKYGVAEGYCVIGF